PANVLLSFRRDAEGSAGADAHPSASRLTECDPKITDFGIAKRLDDEQGQTRTGEFMGTPSYVAPVPLTVIPVTFWAEIGRGKRLPDAARPRGKDHVREPSVRRPRPRPRARRARWSPTAPRRTGRPGRHRIGAPPALPGARPPARPARARAR